MKQERHLEKCQWTVFFGSILLVCWMVLVVAGCGVVSNPTIGNQKTALPPIQEQSTTAVGTSASSESVITDDPSVDELNIWCYNEDIQNIINQYIELHPDMTVKINVKNYGNVDEAYSVFLARKLASGETDLPDIFFIQNSYLPQYTKGDLVQYAATYQELGIDVDAQVTNAGIARYLLESGSNEEGELVGLPYESTCGAFVYRRSIAKDIWGTDEPTVIQENIGPGWEKFYHTAETLEAKGFSIVSGERDIWKSLENSAAQGWIVKGKLFIDPLREAFLDHSKKLADNGYSNKTQSWTREWYDDMRGAGTRPVFGFFAPAWMINYVMVNNADGTKPGEGVYGDWAVCVPPVGFYWGGITVIGNKNTKLKASCGDIIEWMTFDSTDTGLQHFLANGQIKGFEGIKTPVTSQIVMQNSDGTLDYLGGQNMYGVLSQAANFVNGSNGSPYDEWLNAFWCDQVSAYANGTKTREQAIADFRKDVNTYLDIPLD